MGGTPSRILGDTLIQGGENVLDNAAFFEKHGITHVVGVCHRTVKPSVCPTIEAQRILFLDLDDHASDALLLAANFERTTAFIHEARRQGGRVYVHCSAGVSRSSTVSLAYLMTWLDLDYASSLRALKAARPVVSPNYGFAAQLQQWEKSDGRRQLRAKLLSSHASSDSVHADWQQLRQRDIDQLAFHLVAAGSHAEPLSFIDEPEPYPLGELTDEQIAQLRQPDLEVPRTVQ